MYEMKRKGKMCLARVQTLDPGYYNGLSYPLSYFNILNTFVLFNDYTE